MRMTPIGASGIGSHQTPCSANRCGSISAAPIIGFTSSVGTARLRRGGPVAASPNKRLKVTAPMRFSAPSLLIPVLVGLTCLVAPSMAQAQGGLVLTATRVPDFAAQLLVAQDVKQRDIRPPAGVRSDIYIMRLLELAEIGGCKGTDAACKRHYGLLIGTGGMPGDAALYDLGSVGEITEIAWVSSPPQRASGNPATLDYADEATVEVTVQNYPTNILAGDRSLKRVTKRYRLLVNLQRLTLEELR